MSMTTPIVDFVRSYAQSGTARLHMPGHKGQSLLGFEPLDITEICGADELYAPEGIIAESEANATRLFGTAHSYYSTEGSSQCIPVPSIPICFYAFRLMVGVGCLLILLQSQIGRASCRERV